MLQISSDLIDHLNQGGTLVVPSRQRAVALRVAYTDRQIRDGRRVWSTPAVLPWGAWLQHGLDRARERGETVPRRLSAAQEWLLWREAVREACADLPVPWPDNLVDDVRRASGLLEDHGLNLRSAVSAESALLLRARAHVQRRCRELNVLRGSSWRDCEPYVVVAAPTLWVGFSQLGAAQRAWLERLGVQLPSPRAEEARGSTAAAQIESVSGCEDPAAEAATAARWCAARLERDPAARLLLVVPQLEQQRHHWVRALSRCLDYRSILEPGSGSQDNAYVMEGGVPLGHYPQIDCALRLIALYSGQVDFAALSSVLRAPFFAAWERESRLRIDVWLREHNVELRSGLPLPALLSRAGRALGAPVQSTCAALSAALAPSAESERVTGASMLAPALPALWARRYAELLERCGWPGSTPSSPELQLRMRFDELLGDFAAVSPTSERMSATEAAELLRQLAARTAFEPASDDIPVTVTDSLEDPIVHYDGIWVAGLSADVWPQVARPDPLIPQALQYAAGMALASPDGQLRLAEDALTRWRRASSELQLSWSRSDGDLRLDPSPLLPASGVGVAAAASPSGGEAPGFELDSWLAAQSPALELWTDVQGPAWPTRLLPGGTRLLELQSLCPFRGFAQLRLGAETLAEPVPGIDALLRGQILHRVLELFWLATGDSETLGGRSPEASVALARNVIAQALRELEDRLAGLLEPSMLRREGERAERLLRQLIEWEFGREPFRIAHLEWTQLLEFEDATLRVRLDRVDRLGDGRLIVIDYKSGAARAFDPWAARPEQPQLLAYALTAGTDTAAVLALYLNPAGPKLRGIAESPGRVPGLRQAAESVAAWAPLLQQWRVQLQAIVAQFKRGYAAVEPQYAACARCHLQALCRVDPALLPQSRS